MAVFNFTVRAEDSLGRIAVAEKSITLESDIEVPTPFFSSDPMLSSGWEPVSYPSGFYNSGTSKTYVVWQFVGLGGYKGVHVAAYDHVTSVWGDRISVGNFLLANDDHGHPALVRDAEGYIHCYYGSHNNGQKNSVTNAPDDISSWTQRPDTGSALTYPKPVLVGSTIYLFVRDSTTSSRLKLALSTTTPSAGIGTYSALQMLVDFGADSRVYTTEPHLIGTGIHFCCMYTQASDTTRKHIYYMVLDTTTGSISNFDGSTTVASGSLPITLAQADSSFRVFDHGANDGDVPSLQFDSIGNAHILFADGVTPNYDLKHVMLSGGVWSSPVVVASVIDISAPSGYVGSYCLVPGATGSMQAWYNVNGDKMRRVRDSGGVWALAETIKAAAIYNFVQAAAIRSAHSNLRALFSENSGGAIDANAAMLGLYAYGDSGPVNNAIDMTPIDTKWNDVSMMLGANHRNNATSIIDESIATIRCLFSGNARIDTSQTPFVGRASLRLDGSGDYVTAINNAKYSMAGTSDVCLDFWFRMDEIGRLQIIAAKRPSSGTSEWTIFVNASNQLQFLAWDGTGVVANLTGTTAITTGVWRCGEISRIGGTFYMFLEGNLEASAAQSAAPTTNSQSLLIGRDPSNTSRDFNGWLAELRFTGSGRNSSSYAPPTGPFPRR